MRALDTTPVLDEPLPSMDEPSTIDGQGGHEPASGVLAAHGPLCAALLGLLLALPSLGVPFLSDDWMHLAFAGDGEILKHPLDYFRPLCSISYVVDWRIWGLSSAGFHAAGILLAAAAAALVVVVTRIYTGDPELAAWTGLAFALHPYHVGTVAWVAARSDLLAAVLVLFAAWRFALWSERPRGLPWGATAAFAAALLAKESAVVFPAFAALAAVVDRQRRLALAGWLRGLLPLVAVALMHFLWLRPMALGGSGAWPLDWTANWRGNLMTYGATALLPLPPELFQHRLWTWGAVAALAGLLLLVAARLRAGRIPVVVWPAAAAFVVLLGPSLIGFAQRYAFLPGAAAALTLVALVRACGRRLGAAIGVALAVIWLACSAALWSGWYDAGAASERMVAGLLEASEEADVDTLIVVAAPHRVHGVPVTGNWERAVPLAGGNEVSVRTATEFDFPSRHDQALVNLQRERLAMPELAFDELLYVRPGLYSRYVWPRLLIGSSYSKDGIALLRESETVLRVEIERRPRRAVLFWRDGRLEPIDTESVPSRVAPSTEK